MKSVEECAAGAEPADTAAASGAAQSDAAASAAEAAEPANPPPAQGGPDAGLPISARIVARVIDPAVRDDGLGEPLVLWHTQRSRAGDGQRHGLSKTGHPVRDRLVAKAEWSETRPAEALEPPARDERAPAEPPPRSDEPWFSSLREPRPRRQPSTNIVLRPRPALRSIPARGRLTPKAKAAIAIGGLLGSALVAFIVIAVGDFAFEAPTLSRVHPSLPEKAAEPAPSENAPAAPMVKRAPRQKLRGPWRIADAAGDARYRRVEGKIGNAPFLTAVQRAGLERREAYRVLQALDGVKDLDRCRPRDSFSALVDVQSGRLEAFEFSVSNEEVYQARQGPDGLLHGSRLDLMVRRERALGVVVLQGGFEESALRAGFEPGLGRVVNKALAGHSSIREMRDGDVLGVVAQEVTVLGEFSRYAGVEALEYRPVGGDTIRIYYHAEGKSRGYVDAKGRVFGKSRWARPVAGAPITSRFNPRRLHPILKRIKPHNGTDFGAPTGTPVLAAAIGTVKFVGKAGPNGNMVTLRHAGGYETSYSHLSRFAKGLKVNARVQQKQVIGYVGSTGRSTGPHLHFSAKRNRRFIDPESLDLDALSRLPASDRGAFAKLRKRYDPLLESLRLPEPRAPRPPVEPATAVAVAPPAVPGPGPAPALAPVSLRAPLPLASPPANVPKRANVAEQPAAIYLSDQELRRLQPVVHDGEIEPSFR